jgi:hypothetical protein
MRRYLTIFGIILTVVILLSGSAVAPDWHYAEEVALHYQCTYEEEALGYPDGVDATIGENPDKLGTIVLDLGADNEMGDSQDFTVFASSVYYEEYDVGVSEDTNPGNFTGVGSGNDTSDNYFRTPSTKGKSWRYIIIEATSGHGGPSEDYYGPEIDAVGWYG